MLTLQRELGRFLGGSRRKVRQPDLDRKEREAFKRLAKQHGFTFKKTSDGYLETSAFEGFPKGFNTAFHNWPETLERIEACIADPSIMDKDGYYTE